MSDWSAPWLSPEIARQQRGLVDRQLQAKEMPVHFRALVDAVRATQCPGDILEVGCGTGHGREVLDRAGVECRSYSGVDVSEHMLKLAKERYPESSWITGELGPGHSLRADVVVDGSCVLHVEDWRGHLAALCRASRRWVVLHRIPVRHIAADPSFKSLTRGYGQDFPCWEFAHEELTAEMAKHGFVEQRWWPADGESRTVLYVKPRHWATYLDRNYLSRLKALHASMVRHCQPFKLSVLAWDAEVAFWAHEVGCDVELINDFLARHEELWTSKLPGPPRTRVEQMYTLGPRFVADIMERTGEPASYVDADLYAFSSPEPFFAEAGGAPAAFVGHNFAPASRGVPGPTVESHAGPFGALNVGLIHFNDVRVAQRWADLVRAWCFDRCELVDGRWQFADQKRLEQLCEEFPGCVVIKNEAAMVGPWNVNARSLDVREGVPYFGNRPIGFFHFSALQLGPHGQWSPSRPEYRIAERTIDILYAEYLKEMSKWG